MLYNQDREEHARALYNLWKLFESVRADAQRSKECLKRLKDKSLAGTEYQDRAIKETEGGRQGAVQAAGPRLRPFHFVAVTALRLWSAFPYNLPTFGGRPGP